MIEWFNSITNIRYCYIGHTTKTVKQRLRVHFSESKTRGRSKFYDKLKKVDKENVIIRELETIVNCDNIRELENKYIIQYREIEDYCILNTRLSYKETLRTKGA